MTIFKRALMLVAAAPILIAGGWFLLRERAFSKLHVIVDGPLKVGRDIDSLPTDQPLTTLSRGESLPVTDCVYGKNYLNYRIRLPDGRSGYVIAGNAFHVNGPDGPLTDYPQDFCW